MKLLVDVRPIMEFMRNHYTDERLAMLRAHAEDGRLSYHSCCCFVGVATADHPLRGRVSTDKVTVKDFQHFFMAADELSGGTDAEIAADRLQRGRGDVCFRRLLLPLIMWEQRRRDLQHFEDKARAAIQAAESFARSI